MSGGSRFVLEMANDLAALPRLVELTRACRDRYGLTETVVNQLDLALEELVTNTISYGYEDEAAHVIHVTLDVAGLVLTATIEDDARAFNPLDAPPPDLTSPLEQRRIGGLGVHLVREMMDGVRYERVGGRNRWTLTKRLAGVSGSAAKSSS